MKVIATYHNETVQRVLAGKAKGRKLETAPGATRPVTSRIKTIIFDLLREYLNGAVVLDLYAGSGALGIEALSRGAAKAVFVESDQIACELIRTNLANCELSQLSEITRGSIPEITNSSSISEIRFDLVFCDPPYTRLDLFSLNRVSHLINQETTFVLRLPADYNLDSSELAELGLTEVYSRKIGISKIYFLRRFGNIY